MLMHVQNKAFEYKTKFSLILFTVSPKKEIAVAVDRKNYSRKMGKVYVEWCDVFD